MLAIPELAKQIVEKSILEVKENSSRTIFFVGSSCVGKTTLIYSLFDKTDTPRETLVLEYSFGRKLNQKQGLEKIICHIWEYGGKLDILKNILTSIPIKGRYYYFIMIDLSKIKSIWNTIETCLEAMKDTYTESEQLPELILVCGKYDLFKNFDADIKKVIYTTIRSVALLFDAHVLFYSSKDPQLARRAKEMLHSIGFGNGIPIKEKISNFAKPINIPKGMDSWENIGVPESSYEQVKARHLSRILSESGITTVDVTVAPQHPEPSLDSKVANKFDDLRNSEELDISINDYLISLHY